MHLVVFLLVKRLQELLHFLGILLLAILHLILHYHFRNDETRPMKQGLPVDT
jgi:hypothetical protein